MEILKVLSPRLLIKSVLVRGLVLLQATIPTCFHMKNRCPLSVLCVQSYALWLPYTCLTAQSLLGCLVSNVNGDFTLIVSLCDYFQ